MLGPSDADPVGVPPDWVNRSTCLLGAPGQNYLVDESTNLVNWAMKETVNTALDGAMSYGFHTTNGPKRFYRFRLP